MPLFPANCSAAGTAEPEESVAYKQNPDRGQQGINDYDYKKSRYRNDSEDARGQSQISCGLIEDSLSFQHNETDDENRDRKVDYGIENFRVGCQHRGRIICSRDVGRPLDVGRGGSV